MAIQQNTSDMTIELRPSDQPDELRDWKPSRQEWAVMLTLCLASLVVSLDATIIVTALTTIVQALDATATQGFWIGTSYLLTCAVTMLFTESLSEIFGRQYLLFGSVVIFTIGTVLCCTAQNIAVMLAGRSIQGVGGGGVIILSLVIFTDIIPLRFRPKYLGTIQGAWAVGTCTGPVIGGILAKPNTWRWVFYLMFPMCGTSLVLIPLFIRLKGRSATLQGMLTRIDWIGGFLFISSTTSFLIGLSWGGSQFSWSSFSTLVPLILGALGVALTLLWERYRAVEPFLRHTIFHCRSAIIIYVGTFIQGFLLYAVLYYSAFFFESVKLDSPTRTGVSLLPTVLILMPTAVIVGALITRTAKFRWAIWSGFALVSLSSGLMILWDKDTGTGAWVSILIVLGVGHGLTLNGLTIGSQATALPGDEAKAAATYSFMRNFGMACGVGIGGTIFQNIMKRRLAELGLPESLAMESEAYVLVLRGMANNSERTTIISAYVAGFHGVFGFLCALAGVALILTLWVNHFDIDKELTSEHKLDNRRSKWRFRSDRDGGSKDVPAVAVPAEEATSGPIESKC